MDQMMLTEEGQTELKAIMRGKGNRRKEESEAGCTAVVVLIVDDMLYCANAGDSRALICSSGNHPIAMSIDHKPDDLEEYNRITKAGGTVST